MSGYDKISMYEEDMIEILQKLIWMDGDQKSAALRRKRPRKIINEMQTYH